MAGPHTSRLTETFDLLSHPYRRYVLYYLTRESEAVGIDTLAAVIANWDGDGTKTPPGSGRRDVETALRHTHLPKLADAGIVLFGTNADAIEFRATDRFDRILEETARLDGYMQTAPSE
ncbi:DUF7344 domain-containing protein [Natrinema longum]|uniref:ArsR family transcriptional regulator n=1 Tax=Natrinema longum TaxID=370324 RepID=A0A8A2UDC4_9EURY|nr:ArsR family transcriptional regulator [Natrinema longum]MBZ6496188.1 ArsR family transcriptional regulator [Natrinema longum]QSW85888.1 ArsR family transcriptional regulator [Natrinema longum]